MTDTKAATVNKNSLEGKANQQTMPIVKYNCMEYNKKYRLHRQDRMGLRWLESFSEKSNHIALKLKCCGF